jgi:hypothetical protein
MSIDRTLNLLGVQYYFKTYYIFGTLSLFLAVPIYTSNKIVIGYEVSSW